jgi:glycogen(starch) synthase
MAHKGVQTLLKVFDRYVEVEDPRATLTIVGQGPLRGWIEDYAERKDISRSVRLIGGVTHDRLGPLLDEADVMVHLSRAETFGIAPLEAIGAGLPVVSFRNSGAVETWGDFESLAGVLLPLDSSPSEIVAAIARLRDSDHELDPVAARQMVIERYSPRSVALQLDEIYRRVTA